MTTEERLDRVEAAIKALATIAMAAPYMEAQKRDAAATIVQLCKEFDAQDALLV
jgi:hypothetical protein